MHRGGTPNAANGGGGGAFTVEPYPEKDSADCLRPSSAGEQETNQPIAIRPGPCAMSGERSSTVSQPDAYDGGFEGGRYDALEVFQDDSVGHLGAHR